MARLTSKQARFIGEYFACGMNATQAAIRAGYSKKSAAVIGAQNLKKPYIAEVIAERQAEKAEELQITADDLARQVEGLYAKARSIRRKAEKAEDLGMELRAIGVARGNLELLAKLLGQLDDRPQINLLLAPEWVELKHALIRALAPYPEARTAAARCLMELEGDGSAGG